MAASCACSVVAATNKRIGRIAPPVTEMGEDMIKNGMKVLRRELVQLVTHGALSRQQALDQCPPSKRRIYQQAFLELNESDITGRDGDVQLFIKADKNNGAFTVKDPRPILARKPKFNLEFSRYTKPMEKAMYKVLGPHRNTIRTRIFAKGLSPSHRAKLIRRKHRNMSSCVVFSIDVKRFDASVVRQHLAAEYSLFRAVYGCDDLLEKLLKMHETTQVRHKDLRFVLKSARCTGDSDTGMGNSFIMVLVTIAILERLGCHKWDILDDGDDLLLFVPRVTAERIEPLIVELYTHVGFDIAIDRANTLEEVQFCRSRYGKVNGAHTMIRDMKRALACFGVTHKVMQPREQLRRLRGVAMCELSISGGVPMIGELANAVLEVTEGYTEIIDEEDLWKGTYRLTKPCRSQVPIDVTLRPFIARCMGISVEDQYSFTQKIPELIDDMFRSVHVRAAPTHVEVAGHWLDLQMWAD